MRWKVWLAVAAGVAALAAVTVWYVRRPGPPSLPQDPFPLPALSKSPYLNTGPDARYVGMAACKECHAGNHESYLHTAHSRALSEADPNREPPDASFEHKPSGRSYRVHRKDGQFRHEEVLRAPDGKVLAKLDLPIRYLIGSGAFSRTYAAESDGFLFESPISWYAQRKRWGTSPGYDRPVHPGFQRMVTADCLVCHAGRVQRQDDTEKLTVAERAIGCESCHGPGSKHAEYHRSHKHPPGTDDFTIVHPAKLPRDRLEAICAACHLQGDARADVRGRKLHDFRPGLPLSDYRVHYAFAGDSEQMTVVGHFEQLKRSACYQKSEGMTCLSCHRMHPRNKPADTVEFYRQRCLNCHAERGCSLPHEQRLKKQPKDDCSACHMPRGDTDVPHVAFTHHRILRLPQPARHESAGVADLVPIDESPQLGATDRKRNLGLAYLLAASEAGDRERGLKYQGRARDLLEAVLAAGLRDGATLEALSKIYRREQNAERSRSLAQEALATKDLPTEARGDALVILSEWHLSEGRIEEGMALVEELTRFRRTSDDWRILGVCHLRLGRPEKALPAFEKALAINPFDPQIHTALAEAHHQLGDERRAREHARKAEQLKENARS
jgi:Tfp pilus assembly protein PilF